MPKVTYIEHNGKQHVVTVPAGTTVMRGAVDNNIPGIDGDCGGLCACATCHVFVDPAWLTKVGAANSGEADMLSFAENTADNSRLGCQMEITDALDGLVVRMPEAQH
jgi:ferredoxin, 2Fe-2S